jgi:DNA recombination protein RmuC
MGSFAVSAVIAVAALLLGLWLGIRQRRTELADLRAKADERERFKAQAEERDRQIEETRLQKAALEAELRGVIGERDGLGRNLAVARQELQGEAKKYEQMKADLEKSFGDLAARALSANNQSFLALAQEKLGAQNAEARRDLADKELAIKKLVDPLDAALKNLDGQARAMEEKRAGSYAEVKALVETMHQSIPASLDALKSETAQLISALRAPKTRGNWGELQLKRCVEYAGMVAYCSFHEQISARDEDDRVLRPDMTIQLPNGREIVVDAKTPLDAFLDAGNADLAAQKLRFEAHARRVREHMRDLDGKAYWKQFEKAPDFVVCFLPSEALFSAALEADPSLIEFSAQHRVVLATPTTLIALLRAVDFGWQQMEITKNAKAIHEAGRKIYDKLVIAQGHVQKLGDALERGVDYYNKFLGTVEGRGGIFYQGRQLGELVHSDHELEEIKTLPPGTRPMESGEWAQPLFAVAASESGETE